MRVFVIIVGVIKMEEEKINKTEKEFNSLIENLTDNQFWKWVSGWFSEDFIMDIINNWDIETKEEEIKNLKEIIKNE